MRPELEEAEDNAMELGFTAGYTVFGLGILALEIWQMAIADPKLPWYTDVADTAAPLSLVSSPLVPLSSMGGQEWAGIAKVVIDFVGDAIAGAFVVVEAVES
jgi:hypothetical protein